LALKDKLWSAAVAYTKADFLREMDELKGINSDAYNYLSNINLNTWSKSRFSTFPKCDLIVNNLSECLNAWILKSRDLLIISMMEMLMKKLMKRYQKKREGISTMDDRICPKIRARLDECGQDAGHCYCTYAADGLFEVTHKEGERICVEPSEENMWLQTMGHDRYPMRTCNLCNLE